MVAHKNTETPISVPEKKIELDIDKQEQVRPEDKAIEAIYGENDIKEINLELNSDVEVKDSETLDLTDQSKAKTIDDMHDVPAYLRNKNKS